MKVAGIGPDTPAPGTNDDNRIHANKKPIGIRQISDGILIFLKDF